MRPRTILRQVHLWAGLALSLVLFMLAVTGGALVYKEAYWRLVYPELRGPAPTLDAGDQAAAVAAAHARFGDELRSVKMPEPGVSAYHLYLDDGEAFLSVEDHRVIDRWRPSDRLMPLLFDLHAHLMAGEAGERVGGVIGLVGGLMVVTGVILWWPARRRFALAHVLPRGTSRRALLVWHRDLGTVASPLLLVLLLTGSGLVFYNAARAALNGMFGDPVPVEAPPVGAVASLSPPADAALLSRARAAFPGARLVFYYPPAEGGGLRGFRLKQPCELHPNGRSYLYLDPAGEVVHRADACAMPPGERAVHTFYPLHAGKAGSGVYKLLAFLGALALAAASWSGAMSYLAKLRLPGPVGRRSGTAPGRRGPQRARAGGPGKALAEDPT